MRVSKRRQLDVSVSLLLKIQISKHTVLVVSNETRVNGLGIKLHSIPNIQLLVFHPTVHEYVYVDVV